MRRADVKHRHRELDVSEVTGTLLHVLAARRTLERAIDGAELGIVETLFAWALSLFVLSSQR